jgi:hypothetical protein
MKAIILLLSVSVGSLVTLANLQRLTSLKDQVVSALPKLEESQPSTPGPSGVAAPTSPVSSLADVVSQYGEPERKERAMNGTTVYYYPYTIIYIQNNVVVGSRAVGSGQVPQAPAPNTTGQRFWGANNNSTAVNITGTGISPATGKVGWQAQNSSLGSASLNGSGPTVPHSTNGAWQGGNSTAPIVSAPRTVVTRPSTGAAMYRSTGGGSTGSSQWH